MVICCLQDKNVYIDGEKGPYLLNVSGIDSNTVNTIFEFINSKF